MRKRGHIAGLIVLAATLTSRADFDTNVWSSYFAINQMAAECYSASVERCAAAGVATHEPSFWDYWLGENYAKMLAVKANIKAVRPYFINPKLADTNRSYLAYLATGSVDGIVWQSDTQFLADIGLPTNALEETPWFKSQYPETTGGWQNIMVCLSNMVVTEGVVDWSPNVWTNSVEPMFYSWLIGEMVGIGKSMCSIATTGSYPSLDIYGYIGPMNGISNGICPIYEFYPHYSSGGAVWYLAPPELVMWPEELYFENARGCWTTYSDFRAMANPTNPWAYSGWATNWTYTWNGWLESLSHDSNEWALSQSQGECGLYYKPDEKFTPYMIRCRPRAHLGGVSTGPEEDYIFTGATTNTEDVVSSNFVGYPVYVCGVETNPVYGYIVETNVYTSEVYVVVATNYETYEYNVSRPVTNTSTIINYEPLVVGEVPVIYSWGTGFEGLKLYTNMVTYNFTPIEETVETISNVFDHVEIGTNETYEFELQSQVLTNEQGVAIIIGEEEDNVYCEDTTNPVYEVTTTTVTTVNNSYITNETPFYASGATVVNGHPVVGNFNIAMPITFITGHPSWEMGEWVITNMYGLPFIYTGFAHTATAYFNWQAPTNFPAISNVNNRLEQGESGWHQWLGQSYINTNFVTRYTDFAGGSCGWEERPLSSGAETTDPIMFGGYVTGVASNAIPGASTPDDYVALPVFNVMRDAWDAEFGVNPPDDLYTWAYGREVCYEFAAIWWNGTNGFRWK